MKPIDKDTNLLKEQHDHMWNIVEQQVMRAFEAFEKNDVILAKEVVRREKKVDTQELVVDHHCENYIAIFAPVAIDLRFVLSIMKIANNLERIGDFAESVAKFVIKTQTKVYSDEFLEKIEFKTMSNSIIEMFALARLALQHEDSSYAIQVMPMDEVIDDIHKKALPILIETAKQNPESTEEMFRLASLLYKIERMGDRTSNIAEDIIFYLDSKEMRHHKK